MPLLALHHGRQAGRRRSMGFRWLLAVLALVGTSALESQGVALPDVSGHTFHQRFPLRRVSKVGLPGGEVTAMDAGQYFVYVATSSQILKINRHTMAVDKAFPLTPAYKDVTAMRIDHPDVYVAARAHLRLLPLPGLLRTLQLLRLAKPLRLLPLL